MFIYNFKINGGIALKIIIILLSIFMLIIFGISIYRIFFASGNFKIDDKIISEEIAEIQPNNYTNILQAVHQDLNSYVGMKIKFVGYVYKVMDFNDEQFVLARDMYINDNQLQTVVVGFLSQYKNAKNYKENDWVEVTGIIEKGKYHNEEIPIIKVTDIKLANMPKDCFVMPPSDTYIPTSGLL